MWNGNGYRPGRHYVECQRCEKEILDDEARREWNGLIVCEECWEPRHSQEFVRAPKEKIAATGLVNPEPEDTFVEVTYGDSGIPTPPDGTFNNGLD